MTIFNRIKTDNPIIDTILSTIVLTILGYILNAFSDHKYCFTNYFNLESIVNLYYKNIFIELEGRRSCTTSVYSTTLCVSSTYSNRFKAVWFHINKNIDNNKTIYKIKESHSSSGGEYVKKDANNLINGLDMFIVSQPEKFVLDKNKNIYALCKSSSGDENTSNDKVSTRIEKITIQIYSNKISLSELQQYINDITIEYLSNIKTNRFNKKFIYVLEKIKSDDEDSRYSNWSETEFVTCRTFNNLFFDGKKELLEKIDFFINNREWYEKKGIPWTCGIGLSGPPGTGKTSFIKALGKHTGYHLVFLSLKIIKTRQQLQKFFFEDRYNSDNDPHSITFEKKITVIEDIDCIGDIILKREKKFNKKLATDIHNTNSTNSENDINDFLKGKSENDNVKLGDVLKSVMDINASDTGKMQMCLPKDEDLITLDDILNLWDGIRETPGRILMISSNHYNELDPALIRPGRIDITHEFSNASHNTISEMYRHLFEKEINRESLETIQEFLYSPAEIINVFLSTKNEDAFVKRLSMNKKLQ